MVVKILKELITTTIILVNPKLDICNDKTNFGGISKFNVQISPNQMINMNEATF